MPGGAVRRHLPPRLVKVAAAEGHDDAAEQMLDDDIFDRTDDSPARPSTCPSGTGDIVGKQGVGKRRSYPT